MNILIYIPTFSQMWKKLMMDVLLYTCVRVKFNSVHESNRNQFHPTTQQWVNIVFILQYLTHLDSKLRYRQNWTLLHSKIRSKSARQVDANIGYTNIPANPPTIIEVYIYVFLFVIGSHYNVHICNVVFTNVNSAHTHTESSFKLIDWFILNESAHSLF